MATNALPLGTRPANPMYHVPRLGGDNTASAWEHALANYQAARALSDACPADHPDEDRLLDLYCEAMDAALIDTPAPDWAAVVQKMDWAAERQRGFGLLSQYANAIRADVVRLAKLEG